MSRPRPSVLAQFDPLLSDPPASDSDPEYDSEKENNIPVRDELTMSTFFNRTYKRDHAMPAPLTRRLVDVGDVTIHDASSDEENSESGTDMQTPKRRPELKPQSRTPRTPLAELPLERDLSPLPRKKVVKRELALKSATTSVDTDKPSSSSSLSFLIDAVNLAGTSFARSHTASSNAGSTCHPPEIRIQSSGFASSLIQETAPPFDLAASTITQPRVSDSSFLAPPFTRPATSPAGHERARESLDLDASFNLSASETSFDLLNDRMSFLDEKSFNMSFGIVDDDVSEPSQTFKSLVTSGPTSPSADLDDEVEDKDVTPTQEKLELVLKPKGSPSSPLSEMKDDQASPAPLVLEDQTEANLVTVAATQSLATPAVHRAAATTVPALRIVKRTKRLERPASSAISGKASTQSASATVGNNLEKSPASSDSESSVRPPRITSGEQSPLSPVFKAVRCHGGPMRIPISEAPAAVAKSLAPRATNATGPRRIPIQSQRQESAPATKANIKPARPAPAAGKANLSAVPRPVSAMSSGPSTSRLPAPSGIARRKPTNPSTTTAGHGAPSRVLPRRYGYGQ
ncbi:hypothetical protein D9758_000470 [Tetrapyrgos nigripes]|uniref:Uncharacterized protein n=1 Tax=Tetrapyrgos nigripes TaxID=182062 RepID=A0A8H5LZE1_9AGAR|nr:hypothetical protein D9758_000470 [Tetrapyrgos nigripes]